MVNAESIKSTVREFILHEFLPGERPETVLDTTELITGHIVDSLGTLKLVSFLEETFQITIEPHETDVVYLNTLDDIAALVLTKAGH